jgi:hypothetical protein
MKKNLMILGMALFLGAILNDSAPSIDMSKVFSGRATWQLEDMATSSNQAEIRCFCVADAGNGFCICRNVSDKTSPFVIIPEKKHGLLFPQYPEAR